MIMKAVIMINTIDTTTTAAIIFVLWGLVTGLFVGSVMGTVVVTARKKFTIIRQASQSTNNFAINNTLTMLILNMYSFVYIYSTTVI